MNAQEHMEKIKAAIRDMQIDTGVAVDCIIVDWATTLAGKSTFMDAQFTVRSAEVDEG